MDWLRAAEELRKVRSAFKDGSDVLDAVRSLQEEVTQLAASGQPVAEASAANPKALARKAALVRQHLSVGELRLPDGADAPLVSLARSVKASILGEPLQGEFNRMLDEYRAESRDALQRLEAAREATSLAEARARLLEGYEQLLTSLGTDGGEEGE